MDTIIKGSVTTVKTKTVSYLEILVNFELKIYFK